MTDRPIIFSAPMVKALIDGRKTMTRRIVAQPDTDGGQRWVHYPPCWFIAVDDDDHWIRKLRYAPGDRLWVREAVCWVSAWGWRYRADDDDLTEKREEGEVGKWRPSIHMPRCASRLTLTVTDVRVHRLQDITEADAVAEGVSPYKSTGPDDDTPAADAFMDLWNDIYGFDAWDANPWIAALTFTVRRGNIDT